MCKEMTDIEIANKAREVYASNDIEIDETEDDPAYLVHANNGCWVRGWLWVPYEEN